MRDVIRYALAAVGGRGSALALTLFLSFVLTKDAFAQYSYLINLVTVLLLFGQLGLPVLVSREIARYEDTPPLRKGMSVFATVFNLIGLAVAGAALVVIAPSAPAAPHELLLTFGIVVLYSFSQVMTNVLTGLGRVYESYWPDALLRYPVTLVLSVAILIIAPHTMGLDAVLVCLFLAHLATFAVLLFRVMRYMAEFWPRATAEFRIRAWVISVLVLSGSSLATLLNSRVDVLMLEALSSLSELADYAFALQFVLFFTFPTIIANAFLLPRFAGAFGRNDPADADTAYIFASTVTITTTLLVASGFILLALTVWPFVAPSGYESSGALIALFALGYAANAFFGPVSTFMLTFGQERFLLVTSVLSGVLNVMLNWLMIPALGAIGAALATLISMTVANAALFFRSTRIRGSARVFETANLRAVWQAMMSGEALTFLSNRRQG